MRALAIEPDSGAVITPFLPEWVVPLRPGGYLPPVFMFPSSHSDPAMRGDAAIAQLVGADRPIWGLALTPAHRDLVRNSGVAALGAEYVRYIRALQPSGPYLLFGNCLGGYLAWESASQLLAQGQEIASIAFFEVPLRADFANVRAGPIPVTATNVWRLGHYYRPEPLPLHVTHVMSAKWHGANWWRPWQQVATLGMETTLLPDGDVGSHAERLAAVIGEWSSAASPAERD